MYKIFDLETTTQMYLKRRASPFSKENWVVAAGYKRQGEEVYTRYYTNKEYNYNVPVPPGLQEPYKIEIEDDVTLLVGFNIKFDLLWSWRHPDLVSFFKRGGKVWDCQYAEYLLEGNTQTYHMVAMDDVVEKYGGELKIDEVKALWKQGINTPDIPKDLLLDYLGNGDIPNTEKIFLGQVARARELGVLQGIMSRMDGLCATAEMEYNGLYIDREQAWKDKTMLEGELEELNKELLESLPELPPELVFNWGSPVMKSCLLFGGAVKYQKWTPYTDDNGNQMYAQKDETCLVLDDGKLIPMTAYLDGTSSVREAIEARAVRYKSGKNAGDFKKKNKKVDDLDKPKGAKKDYVYRFPRIVQPKPEWLGSLKDGEGGAVYSTSGENIKLLAANYPDVQFLQAISLRDKINKDLGTYYLVGDEDAGYKGMLTCVGEDSIIHHKLNHTSTLTSRLSSNDPNLQNVPRADWDERLGREKSVVKRMFISRYGSEGSMIEVDYSQLEVVVQAILTHDKQFIQDVRDGVDFHCKRLAVMLSEPYEKVYEKCHTSEHPEHKEYKKLRTKAKGFTFARAFGAGKASIAANTGMTEEEVQMLIDAESIMYPGVEKFFDSIEQELDRTRKPTLHFEPCPDTPGRSIQCGIGYWTGPTQARFGFLEVPAPSFKRKHNHGKETAWYRPSIQNYPVQGTAGHIVQIALGKLWRWFVNNDNYNGKVLIVNTVHDCVWVDAHDSVAKQVALDVTRILEDVPKYLEELFGFNSPVLFPCEAEIGANLLNMKGVNND